MGIREILERKNASVGVFGIGRSNDGVIRYLKQLNPSIKLTLRSDTPINEAGSYEAERIFFGEDAMKDATEDVIFISPSVRRDRREFTEAQEKGVTLSSDAELFFEMTDKKPITVTGSDGKSTTTHLIAETYTLSGEEAAPCGNYGRALTSLLDTDTFPVAELSSFQLSYATPKSSYAVITNVTPNHLNWHTSFDEYIEAKMNITRNAERIVFDADSDTVCKRLSHREVFVKTSLLKSYEALRSIGGARHYVTFENGIILVDGMVYLDISRARRHEEYNIRNYMLTTGACMEKCTQDALTEAITTFVGLSHRAEEFFKCGGVKFIDSSIDSTPERTLKTLSALSEKPIVIIGGLGKGLSLEALATMLPSLTRGAVLLGTVGKELHEILLKRDLDYKFELRASLNDAVKTAYEMTSGNGTVILSPAATSFDNYKNFSERGNAFKRVVFALFRS